MEKRLKLLNPEHVDLNLASVDVFPKHIELAFCGKNSNIFSYLKTDDYCVQNVINLLENCDKNTPVLIRVITDTYTKLELLVALLDIQNDLFIATSDIDLEGYSIHDSIAVSCTQFLNIIRYRDLELEDKTPTDIHKPHLLGL